jgi:hypothetical protein
MKMPKFVDIAYDYQGIDKEILYANGMPIVFTENNERIKIRTGMRGIITACYPDHNIDITIYSTNNIVRYHPITFEYNRWVYNNATNQVEDECVARVDKLPFVLGFAIPVHRC